ncbi:MAG TPA: hypothetical protein PKD91_12595 [Bacteroidia bacterium]|nr:hypothetical protein [Bacteroidia bacterium]
MKNHYILRSLATIICVITISGNMFAQNYFPDSSFNGNGIATFTFYNNIDRGFGCAIQPDQKLVMVGLSKNPSTNFFELCVARFNLSSTFDTTFSGDGKSYVSMGNQSSIGGQTPKLKFDSDGKIVIVNSGRSNGGSSQDIMICRLDTNGVLDNTFNGSGVLFVDMTGGGSQPDQASDFDFDAQGNIYVVGATRTGGTPLDNDFAVIKVSPNGQLVTSFDGDGKKLFNPTGFAEFATGVRVLSDGKIVFGGSAGSNVILMKIDSTGALDNTFNGTGSTSISFGSSMDMYGMELDSDERIIIAGTIYSSITNSGVARCLQTGLLDSNFGTGGKLNVNIGAGNNEVFSLYLLNDDKILIGGAVEKVANGYDFMAARIDTSGSLDLTFNTTGFITQNLVPGNVDEFANSMAVTADGRIVLSGTVEYGSAINEDVGLLLLKTDTTTGVPTLINPSFMEIFPNPSGDELTITV